MVWLRGIGLAKTTPNPATFALIAAASSPEVQVELMGAMNGRAHALEVAMPANREREAFGQGAYGSYNQSQMQGLINKVDELINALRR